jgi:hypothetical protein
MKDLLAKKMDRWTIEYPVLRFLREQEGAVYQEAIDVAIAKAFGLNRLDPLVKARVKQEISFCLSRLQQLHLVTRYGDGRSSVTADGRTITPEKLAEIDAAYSSKERKARYAASKANQQ